MKIRINLVALFFALLILKVSRLIALSWWIVFLPVYLPILIPLFVVGVALGAAALSFTLNIIKNSRR